MDTLKIVKKLVRIQNLTAAEERSTAVAFNNSKAIVGCLTDYLGFEIAKLDKQLNNPSKLYAHAAPDRHVAFILAERSTLVSLLELLTLEAKVLDDDPSGE